MKVISHIHAFKLEDIPNVGPEIASDLRQLGIETPKDLIGKDAVELYVKLNQIFGKRQDPCILDTFMSVIDFMNGAKPVPWWHYTPERKKRFPNL